jgi:hypothetical protein
LTNQQATGSVLLMTTTDPLAAVREAAIAYGHAQRDFAAARAALHRAIREAAKVGSTTHNKIAEAARPMSRPTVFKILTGQLYGEIRHRDGTPLPGSPVREPLDTHGRSTQAAVDDLANELREQGGWGDIDLGGISGQVAVYAVGADGTVADDAASAPWWPRRRTARP